jgi:methyl-accepting chemotaxis protein
VSDPTTSVPYRRIGTILVEMGSITQDQLEYALTEQSQTGRLLGEILVSSYGVSRVDLADALAAQWEEAKAVPSEKATPPRQTDSSTSDQLAEADLHVLLEEAQAARDELTARTDELSRRLASLEALVVGVSDALDELRSTALQTRSGHAQRSAPQREPRQRPAA